MAELLQAIDKPAFNWYPKWITLNGRCQPKNPIKYGMSQPPTIKIQWSTPSRREMSCNITPNRGLFGPGYALAYTIPDFEKMLFVRWDKDHKEDPNNMKKKCNLFRGCLEGTAATKWDLWATKYKGTKRTEKNFKQCLRDDLEVTTKCTNLGDQVIRWLHLRSKPGHMWFEDFLNRQVQILDYVKKGYLCRRMELPNDVDLCK
jgi:hypothetical protein